MKLALTILLGALTGLLIALAIFYLYQYLKPKQTPPVVKAIVATPTPQPKYSYSAWLPWWDEESALKSLENGAGEKLDTVMPVWYNLSPTGEPFEVTHSRKQLILNLAQEKNLKIMPTISNATTQGFDSKRVVYLLTNVEAQDKFIAFIIKEAANNDYIGWDIDLEEIPENQKEEYAQFIKKVADELHKNSLIVSVDVHALTGQNDWVNAKGHDYQMLGDSADLVRIMAYDFHHAGSRPGAVTPLDKFNLLLKKALSEIPKEKLVVALPLYGYDWGASGGESITFEDASKSAQVNKSQILRNNSMAPHFTYNAGSTIHTIYFNDAETVEHLIDIAKQQGITQFSFWSIGGEDQKVWEKID